MIRYGARTPDQAPVQRPLRNFLNDVNRNRTAFCTRDIGGWVPVFKRKSMEEYQVSLRTDAGESANLFVCARVCVCERNKLKEEAVRECSHNASACRHSCKHSFLDYNTQLTVVVFRQSLDRAWRVEGIKLDGGLLHHWPTAPQLVPHADQGFPTRWSQPQFQLHVSHLHAKADLGAQVVPERPINKHQDVCKVNSLGVILHVFLVVNKSIRRTMNEPMCNHWFSMLWDHTHGHSIHFEPLSCCSKYWIERKISSWKKKKENAQWTPVWVSFAKLCSAVFGDCSVVL